MPNINLQEVHDALIEVAKKAGLMITSAHPSTSKTDTKKNSSDLVTETDQAVEKMVSNTLKSRFPDYEFVGEETYHPGLQLTPAPTFVVDPIDGTTNFVHGFQYVSLSLGFVHNLVPLVGVVYNPFLGQLYHAIHGEEAYLTTALGLPQEKTRKLECRQEPLRGLNAALIAVEWGNERHGNNWEVKTKTFSALAGSPDVGGAMVHSLRSLGSAALNLCAVATGAMDAYWEGGCWAWDVAAGWVILKEAGGIIVSGNKDDWEPKLDGRVYLAVRSANKEEQVAFVKDFWGNVKGKLEY